MDLRLDEGRIVEIFFKKKKFIPLMGLKCGAKTFPPILVTCVQCACAKMYGKIGQKKNNPSNIPQIGMHLLALETFPIFALIHMIDLLGNQGGVEIINY